MNPVNSGTSASKLRWPLFGAVGAALMASACCTIPLLLVAAGAGGAWLATLRAVAPLRPLFVVGAFGLLWLGWRRLERSETTDCADGVCADPRQRRRMRILFGIVTVVTLLLIVSPHLIALLVG